MKKALLLIPLLFFFENCFSQSGWVRQNSGTNSNLYSVGFINATTGVCVGSTGVILRTTNGGMNWIQQSSGYTLNLRSLSVPSASSLYACGDSGLVLKSADLGVTWTRLNLIKPLYQFNSVFFVNDSIGYIGGIDINFSFKFPNQLFKTLDGGNVWDSISTHNSSGDDYTKSLFFISSTVGWKTEGQIPLNVESSSKTENGGINWIYQYGNSPPCNTVYFIDSLNGWLGSRNHFGSASSILRTTDGGNNWLDVSSPVLGNTIYSIDFVNIRKGWACGERHLIFSTTNSGINWIQQTLIQEGINYRSVCFTDSLTGWVAGDSGRILKTTNGGILTNFTNSSSEIPNRYSLSQNYPNPFNPKTVISYELPITGFVSLKVYDVLGNEVAALVNQKQNAGKYEAEFDGRELSSGVYYYRIETDVFSETKKMLLLK